MNLTRRDFLKSAIAMAGAFSFGGHVASGGSDLPTNGGNGERKPNIVLILGDDIGFGDLGYHDNPDSRTPRIDAFAREAIEFTQFYVSPVCSPTRASLMTGRYNFRTGVADVFGEATKMDPAETTIAEALKPAGYVSGVFGKWHLGDEPPHTPHDQGFDESLVHTGPAMRQYFDPVLLDNGEKKQLKGYCLDIFTDRALDFMQRNRARPFFLYLASNLVHTPLQVDPGRVAPFSAAGRDDSTAKIYAMLQKVDDNVGRVLDALRELELERDTLVIFLSDNGPCTGSTTLQRRMAGLHGLKGTPYENGIRVPCFMRWPGSLKAPARVDRIAAHIDIMPTLLEACRITGEDARATSLKLDGVSLMPLLRDPAAPWPDRTLFFQWDSGQVPRRGHAYAVRSQQWKLVQPVGMDAPNQAHIRRKYEELCQAQGRGARTIEGAPRWELYDISRDPGETKDLAAGHPELVEKMKAQYEAWFTDVAARWSRSLLPRATPSNAKAKGPKGPKRRKGRKGQ